MKKLVDWSDTIDQFREEPLMKNNIIQSEMDVKGSKINVVRVNGYEYISLTDLAKTQNDEAPADVVKKLVKK